MDLEKKIFNCIHFITFQWLAREGKEAVETVAETDMPRKEQITGLREQSLIVSIKICTLKSRFFKNRELY